MTGIIAFGTHNSRTYGCDWNYFEKVLYVVDDTTRYMLHACECVSEEYGEDIILCILCMLIHA